MMTGKPMGLVGYEATALQMLRAAGVSQYAGQLLNALVRSEPSWRYALLACRAPACPLPEGVSRPARTNFPNRSLWFQFVLPRIVARLRPDLCHFTNSLAPLSLSCPFLVTVHDMSLFLFPRMQPRRSLWLVRSILPAVAGKAAAIITVSHSARKDILNILRLPPEKVHVVYHAPAGCYRVIGETEELNRVRRKYGLDNPFILTVGTIEPRKNLSGLVSAFSRLRRHGREEQLVMAGQFGWHYRPLLKQIEQHGLRDTVRMLDYVPAADLPGLYNLAKVLAFPSFYEGFGLPIVEAMACGTPVLTSNRSSMSEIGEGAALLVDPMDPEAIKEGLLNLLSDSTLRESLREAGLTRAAGFSWARAAEETARIYGKIVSERQALP